MTIEHVMAFHDALGSPVPASPTVPTFQQGELRAGLIEEEAAEVVDAVHTLLALPHADSMAQVLKELADLQYVLDGLVLHMGFIEVWEEAQQRVHDSNMTKVVRDPERRGDGKVLKGPNYRPPVLVDLVDEGGVL